MLGFRVRVRIRVRVGVRVRVTVNISLLVNPFGSFVSSTLLNFPSLTQFSNSFPSVLDYLHAI